MAAPAIVRVSSLMALSPLPAWRVPDLRDHPGFGPGELSDLIIFGRVEIYRRYDAKTGTWHAMEVCLPSIPLRMETLDAGSRYVRAVPRKSA